MKKKGELSFGIKGLKKEVSLETPSMILEEDFTEVFTIRVSAEMQRDIELLARKLGVTKAEIGRRMLKYALVRGQKCIAPDIVADAFKMKYDRETYMHHTKILQEAGVEITSDVVDEIKRCIGIDDTVKIDIGEKEKK